MKYGLPFEDFISGRDLDGTDARTHHKGICLLGPPLLTQHATFPTRQYCDGITGEILDLIEDQQLSKLNDNNSYPGLSFLCRSGDVQGYLREIELDPHIVDIASTDIRLLAPFYSQPVRLLRQPRRMAGWVTSVVLAYVTCIYLLAIDFASLIRKTGSGGFTKAAIIHYHRLREWLEFAVQICLYSILTRMIASMSAHPRVALFTNTLRSAQSEIVNFSLSFAVLYFGLGLIAWLSFGGIMDEFSTYSATLWTQFYILSSGQWFDSWENDW
ncbi:hypothetical protein Pmar_PMAR005242 [Perkinsus marinus ATCC 50983]|uniref:Polycystin cation channel PKD1/PKD2 domain-containing protein n=1 Tax=Perkinsus marinus (strain ATCC 50983 / TXsc) TaxID=423536 RepID=C5KB06_PERM5|nr:hypothetical protein Pmar_PMAR005242 [Perkinsus marinus ATCC 50983]EER18332.1 hypothetical protein Pmar_PMAR005242 [Perkinsus marinus ATCC 50983]|eukprot:XP_002786536.1 hypothetical protein Pmar_PMAR005242 [Perkinsus marinus ATCC 50983]